MADRSSTFYHQVLNAWGECKQLSETSPKDPWDIRRESLFFNKNRIIDGQYISGKYFHWYRNGIFTLHDILDNQGNFLSPGDIENIFKIRVNVMEYNSLKDSVPMEWRRQIRKICIAKNAISKEETAYITIKNIPTPISLLKNKDVYWLLANQTNIRPKCIARWELKFPNYIFRWPDIFKMVFETVRCTNLQTMQYKIIHRIFPCNYWVAKWKPETTEQCNRCLSVDTLEHFFYHCYAVKTFWYTFTRWWSYNMGECVDLSDQNILFGYDGKTIWKKALNYCILHAKSFIVKSSIVENDPFLVPFLMKVKSALLLEKTICVKNEQLENFEKYFGKLFEEIG